MSSQRGRWAAFFLAIGGIVLLDVYTKVWAFHTLEFRQTIRVAFDLIPLTLSLNQGAAFGISLGDFSRPFFGIAAVAATLFLTYLFHRTPSEHRLRLIALPLIVAGALGNLIDRVRWEHGVVDFIGPFNLGFMYWPVFNVADMAITCGAVALAISLWLDDRRERAEARAAAEPTRAKRRRR